MTSASSNSIKNEGFRMTQSYAEVAERNEDKASFLSGFLEGNQELSHLSEFKQNRIFNYSQKVFDDPAFRKVTQEKMGQLFQFLVQKNQTNSVRHFMKSASSERIRPEDLDLAFTDAAKSGNVDLVRVLSHDGYETHFGRVPPNILSLAFCDAMQNGHSGVVEELMASPSFKKVSVDSLDQALQGAAQGGHADVVDRVMAHPRFVEVSVAALRKELRHAARKGNTYVVEKLIANKNFKDIPVSSFGLAFRLAVSKGHIDVVNTLMGSPYFAEVPADTLGLALNNAVEKGHTHVVKALMANPRFAKIDAKYLQAATKGNHAEIVVKLEPASISDTLAALFRDNRSQRVPIRVPVKQVFAAGSWQSASQGRKGADGKPPAFGKGATFKPI